MSGSIAWDPLVPRMKRREIGVYALLDGATDEPLIVGGTVDGNGFNGRVDNYKKMLTGRHKRKANADLQRFYDGGGEIVVTVLESRRAGDPAVDAAWKKAREARWIADKKPRLNKLGADAGAAMCEPGARARNAEIERRRAAERKLKEEE